MIDGGWLSTSSNDSIEFGPSCGLLLSIVARRESLECAIARPDGRLIPRDDDPSKQFEFAKTVLIPRKRISKGRYPGLTPSEFSDELAALVNECLAHRRSVSDVGFAAVCIAWPGRIDRFARRVKGGRPLGDVFAYEQKAYGGWTVDNKPVSLADQVEKALEKAGFKQQRPPILVVNDADSEVVALANMPLDERSPTQEEAEKGGPAAHAKSIFERIEDSEVALSITVAGGVGGALLIDGALVRGQRGFVGELGEVPVDIKHKNLEKGRVAELPKLVELQKQKFLRWDCPHEDTLDSWASGRTILDQLWLAELPDSKFRKKRTYTEELELASKHSNMELATAILKRAGRLIGLGIIGPVLMLDPGVILVSSSLPSGPIADGIKELLNDEIGEVNPHPEIVLAVDNDPARLLKGTARWAIQEIIDPALDKVCSAKNHELKKLDAPQLSAWPRAAKPKRSRAKAKA